MHCDIKNQLIGAERVLAQMKGKLTIQNKKSLRLSHNLVRVFLYHRSLKKSRKKSINLGRQFNVFMHFLFLLSIFDYVVSLQLPYRITIFISQQYKH